MQITLRRAKSFLRLGDLTADDDFDVMDQGKRIGRAYFQPGTPQPWRWSISQAVALGQSGRADTRAHAVEQLTRAYSSLHLTSMPLTA